MKTKKYLCAALSLGVMVSSVAITNGFNQVYGVATDGNQTNNNDGNLSMDLIRYLTNNTISVSCPGSQHYNINHPNYNPRFDESNEQYNENEYFEAVKLAQREASNLGMLSLGEGRRVIVRSVNNARSHLHVSDPACPQYNVTSPYYRSQLDSSSGDFNPQMHLVFLLGFSSINFEASGISEQEARMIPILVSDHSSPYYNTNSDIYDPELDDRTTEYISERYFAAKAEFLFSGV